MTTAKTFPTIADLAITPKARESHASERLSPITKYSSAGTVDPPVLDLHIRGMRLEEAMKLVEKQLDSALLHGLRQFSIVHGKGEGILRTAVHRYLKSIPAVEDFRFSLPEEGGFGRTIVTLKG